jgi:hypothetical protein
MASIVARTLISFAVLTAAAPFGRALADEAGCLVIGAWDEARGEPAPVIEAVVSTIINRARARGISVCDAVMDPAALTGVTPAMHELFAEAAKPHDGSTPQPHNDQDRAQLAIVLATAERAVAGRLPDPTYGATHFYSPSGMRELGLPSEPDWAAAMVKTATVGPFVFLREKGQTVAAEQAPPIVPVASSAAHLSRNDPIFALAPPPPAPPVVIEAVPFAAPSEPTLHSKAVAALAPMPSMMMLPIEPVPTPAPIRTPTVVPIATASVPLPMPVPAVAEDWVAPASPFDPGAPRQVIHASASGPRPVAPMPPVAPMTLGQAARPITEARPVVAARRPVTEARPMMEARIAAKPVKPVAVAALDRTPLHAAPFSPPHVGKTFEVATVVVDTPHYLALPGTQAIVAEAEAPPRSAPQYPAAQESTDDYTQQRGWDTRQAAPPPGYETARRAEPRMEAPPTPLFDRAGNNPQDDDESTDTDTQDDTTQAAPQPAYAPPQYAQRQYAQPTYAQPPSAQPTYAPPQYAAPRYSTPVYRAPTYAPPAYGPPQWNYYWNQAPAYSAPRANPPAGYWPYGPAAWKGCPVEDRKFVLVAAGNGWNQPRLVRRKVCDS